MPPRWRTAVLALAVAASLLTLVGQVAAQPDEVAWTVSMPEFVPDDGRFEVVFEAYISAGWYIYAMDSPAGRPVRIVPQDLPTGFTAGEPTQSGPVEGYDPNFDATVRYFEDYAEFRLPIAVDRSATVGTNAVAGTVEYMYCSERVCWPLPWTVSGAPASA